MISVDTKKKELVGDFKDAGKTWRPKGNPEPVRVHDFIIPKGRKISEAQVAMLRLERHSFHGDWNYTIHP